VKARTIWPSDHVWAVRLPGISAACSCGLSRQPAPRAGLLCLGADHLPCFLPRQQFFLPLPRGRLSCRPPCSRLRWEACWNSNTSPFRRVKTCCEANATNVFQASDSSRVSRGHGFRSLRYLHPALCCGPPSQNQSHARAPQQALVNPWQSACDWAGYTTAPRTPAFPPRSRIQARIGSDAASACRSSHGGLRPGISPHPTSRQSRRRVLPRRTTPVRLGSFPSPTPVSALPTGASARRQFQCDGAVGKGYRHPACSLAVAVGRRV